MDQNDFYDTCENCGKEHVHSHKYSLPVCVECRNAMINRPVSRMVTFFIFGMVVFSLLMLYRLPVAMSAAVEYEKGIKALETGRSISALEYFKKVDLTYPESIENLSSLYEALYKAGNVDEAFTVLDRMIEIEPEPSESIANKTNEITDKINLYYYPSEAFYDLMDGLGEADFDVAKDAIEQYVTQYPEDIVATYVLCDYYYDLKEYSKIELLIEPLCIQYPDWKLGLYTLIPTKRELLKEDESRKYYEMLIALNTEDAISYTIAAKTELKFKNDEIALELGEKALDLLPEDPYVQGVMAMVYHFNSNEKQSRYYLEQFNASNEVDDDTYEFVNSVVADELDWR